MTLINWFIIYFWCEPTTIKSFFLNYLIISMNYIHACARYCIKHFFGLKTNIYAVDCRNTICPNTIIKRNEKCLYNYFDLFLNAILYLICSQCNGKCNKVWKFWSIHIVLPTYFEYYSRNVHCHWYISWWLLLMNFISLQKKFKNDV